ncbi:uncharacterized protein BDR25DRAFT_167585, partial [Lindgomyces ingoldianus]
MRLIHVDTLELKLFNDSELPEYAILSHTWGNEEITLQDMLEIEKLKQMSKILTDQAAFTNQTTLAFDPHLMFPAFQLLFNGEYSNAVQEAFTNSERWFTGRSGYMKIVKCAEKAKSLGIPYIWVDTCCIDKTSSAELQEAINSMYRYYKNASRCIVYLADAMPFGPNITHSGRKHFRNVLASSRWVTRGWTLQELIAPQSIRFYAQDWTYLCSKVSCMDELSEVTGIPSAILEIGDPSQACVAQRMSWASNRSTTRIEDTAYSLMGLFDIQMPMLYGEGEKAFIRLQEEILKTSDDYSIFAWDLDEFGLSKYRGLLARSPAEFKLCGTYERDDSLVGLEFPITSTNLGLHVQLEMRQHGPENSVFIASLRTINSDKKRLGILLKKLDNDNQYARIGKGFL